MRQARTQRRGMVNVAVLLELYRLEQEFADPPDEARKCPRALPGGFLKPASSTLKTDAGFLQAAIHRGAPELVYSSEYAQHARQPLEVVEQRQGVGPSTGAQGVR